MSTPLQALKLRIEPPTGAELPGRGFYQLEEDSLYVQIGQFDSHHRFFSFIDSDNLRMDFDKEGRLLFVELSTARRNWPVDSGLAVPLPYVSRDVRWLDFRGSISAPAVTTSRDRSLVRIGFLDRLPDHTVALAESVMLQVTADQCAVAIWVTHIEDDLAGREIAAFRRNHSPQSPTAL